MRPNILSIAGYDPTGGAGLLADIKTFERLRCQGFGVQTANTIQTASDIKKVYWTDRRVVFEQLDNLLSTYEMKGVKIGLIPSLNFLKDVLEKLYSKQPSVKVVWDPIMKASSGFEFGQDWKGIDFFLDKIYMLTPNWEEAERLSVDRDMETTLTSWGHRTRIYLKGGHHPDRLGTDKLFSEKEIKYFNSNKGIYYPKHGSGCVLSAAIISHICKGHPLQKSILKSKRYMERYLSSDKSLLGIHV